MRSVHLTNSWHDASGGIRTFYLALLDAANRHRRHVTLIVPGKESSVRRVGPYGLVHSVKASRSPLFDSRYRLLLPHKYLQPSRSEIWRILAEEQPDIVEICDKFTLPYLAGLIRRRAGPGPRPTLVGLSSERLDDNMRAWVSGSPPAQAVANAYLRRVYLPLFDAHVAHSSYTAEELSSVVARYADRDWRLAQLTDRIHVVPLGVETDAFSPRLRSPDLRRALLARTGANDSSRLLVYAGRISPEKHTGLLVDMLEDLAIRRVDARLIVCGDGPSRTDLVQQARRRTPGRVLVLGHLGRTELAATLASADVFVHPNSREPFGIGPLEAMASGVPVVAPRAGGVLSYATDANAWLTAPSGAGLATGVEDVLAYPALAGQRARVALDTTRQFSWPAACSQYFDRYDAIHDRRVAGPGTRLRHFRSA